MKKILLFGPWDWNPTDSFIVTGIRTLLRKTFGVYNEVYLTYDIPQVMSDEYYFPDRHFDAIVVCGTPWMWDLFHLSVKWKNLTTLFKVHPNSKKVFLGIGSCLNLDADSSILLRPDEVAAAKEIYTSSLVIVRDKLAKDKLDEMRIKNYLLPCPAYFVLDNHPLGNEDLLIWADPLSNLSRSYFERNPHELQKTYDIVSEYIRRYNPRIVKAHAHENDYFGTPLETLENFAGSVQAILRSNTVLSMRIHSAVPALTAGRQVGLIPQDTRAGVISLVTDNLVTNCDDLSKIDFMNPYDFGAAEENYINLIREYVK